MKTRIKTSLLVVSGVVSAGLSGVAHAALQGRDLNGSPGSFEAYYDTDLNITWLANANLAASNTFGLLYNTDLGNHPSDSYGPSYAEIINTNGSMTWGAALHWIDAMNTANYLGINDWRLPTTTDMGAPGCTYSSVYSGLDCGYNVNPASSEMAHLYFTELGNQSYYTTTGALSGAYVGGANPTSTLDNVGPFTNFQSNDDWSGTEYAPNTYNAWDFNTYDGGQLYYD